MTSQEKQNIDRLRSQGMGYKRILDSPQIGRTCLRDKKREHQKYLKKRLYLRKFTIDNVLCIEYNQLCKRLHDFLKEVDEDGSYNQ